MVESVVIVDGARTPIGTFGGALAGTPPTATAAHVAKVALERAKVDPARLGHAVFGHVINTEPRDMYLARVAAIDAGAPVETPCLTLNRLCGSGAQAVVSAAQHLMLGDCDYALAGGAEAMSRSPHAMQAARAGVKMGDAKMVDMMIGALSDPFEGMHMGVTAENVADDHRISREEQDALALESQRRAARAIAEGRFRDQIAPIEVSVRRQSVAFDTDEHPKPDTTAEGLAKLRPAFRREGGTVTPGNASGINDGAAAVVLATESAARRDGLTPRARLIGYAHAGVRPDRMGVGPVPAVTRLVEKLGMRVDDFDVIESNEAFAAQACAVAQGLGFDPEKLNPNGGAIALGHPIGATGTILVIKAMHELARAGGRFGLITMCIGGGQGIALAIERL